ncbi:hypothetical protein LFZ35_25195 (plasmid) [Salmonella enterica subsp. enterica serovar Onderstepoort str. SA20060086]|nr:hypothetical protein LFZ35_25195 [Salmonella enterica subsp. enterica serovar Onderstepoort str. SA20060086]
MLKLRQPGMETRCPAGAGQRQRSWLGAKHDSPGSRREVALSYGLYPHPTAGKFEKVIQTTIITIGRVRSSGEILTRV